MEAGKTMERAEQLRILAAEIRHRAPSSELMADALEVIAGAMEPCVDCGAAEQGDAEREEINRDSGV